MPHFKNIYTSSRLVSILAALVLLSPVALGAMVHAQGTPAVTQGNQTATPGVTQGNQTAATPASQDGSCGSTICNPLRFNSLNELLTAILGAAIQLGTVILTLALVWVGFQFVAARGNEEGISKARRSLMWTVIGGLILLGATAIQAVITSTVGSLTSS